MFELTNQTARLTNLNIRRELAGKNPEDGRTASDLKLQLKGGNDLLDKVSVHLRGCFYMVDDEKPQAEMLPGTLTKLIHPLMQTEFAYDLKLAGYSVEIDHGIGDPIVLDDCEVNGFRILLQEGGTVGIAFRVQFHPEGEELPLLAEKLQQEVSVTVRPPQPNAARQRALDIEAKTRAEAEAVH